MRPVGLSLLFPPFCFSLLSGVQHTHLSAISCCHIFPFYAMSNNTSCDLEVCTEWIYKVFEDCICKPIETVGFWIGTASIPFEILVMVPQIVTNFRYGSAEGLSFSYILLYFIASGLDLVGALLVDQTPPQIVAAAGLFFFTFILFLQWLFFKKIRRTSTLSTSEEDVTAPSSSAAGSQRLLAQPHATGSVPPGLTPASRTCTTCPTISTTGTCPHHCATSLPNTNLGMAPSRAPGWFYTQPAFQPEVLGQEFIPKFPAEPDDPHTPSDPENRIRSTQKRGIEESKQAGYRPDAGVCSGRGSDDDSAVAGGWPNSWPSCIRSCSSGARV